MRSIFILIIIIYVWSKIIGLIVKTAGGGKNAKKSPQKPVHRNWSQKQESFVKHQKTVVQPKIILQDNDEESVAERQKAINEMKRKKEIEKRDREIKERQKRETSVHKQGLINRNVAAQTDEGKIKVIPLTQAVIWKEILDAPLALRQEERVG
ncbi:hypothetical protein HMPREF1987_00481 [Peptostreptococcaceae bacterium oral taxon 113 str. W5053]|nr:hypothetical protein HMPREF1987_00481 [Peptostreptococcaceae bacterium oral taxon 113 str. W5053]